MSAPEENRFVLRDGTAIYMRPIQPSDRPLFLEGMKLISKQTWLYRFLMPRDHLEEAELDYLLSPDGVTHFALGAASLSADGVEGPVAVARYVVMENTEHVAECAILVVDAWQGRGVGRLMGEHLMAAARERGIRAFHCEILLQNERMTSLLRRLVPDARSHVVGSHVIFRVPLVPGALEAFADPDLGEEEAASASPSAKGTARKHDWSSWTGRWKVKMFWRSREEPTSEEEADTGTIT